MKQKGISNRTACILSLVGGSILIILGIIGYLNISSLGLTPEEYDISRDLVINTMFGGGRATSGSFIMDLLMDFRGPILWVGILFALIGVAGIIYYTKHPEKDKDTPKAPSNSSIQRNQTSSAISPMRAEGGILYFLIALYVVAAICIITSPIVFITYRNMLSTMARQGAVGYAAANVTARLTVYIMLGVSIFLLVAGGFLIWTAANFQRRNPQFMEYYERICMGLFGLSVATAIAANVWVGILLALVSITLAYFSIKWLVISPQVREYMGSGSYVKKGLISLLFAKMAPKTSAQRAQTTSAPRAQSESKAQNIQQQSTNDGWDEWEEVSTPTSAYQRPSMVYIRPDCCCICGNSLREGYAVLFTFASGEEARVDRNCHEALMALFNYQQPADQRNAADYLYFRLNYVDPNVANCVSGYINQVFGSNR